MFKLVNLTVLNEKKKKIFSTKYKCKWLLIIVTSVAHIDHSQKKIRKTVIYKCNSFTLDVVERSTYTLVRESFWILIRPHTQT